MINRTIYDYNGLCSPTQDYKGLYKTLKYFFLECIRLYRNIKDYTGLNRTIYDYRTVQDYTELYRTIPDYIGL